MKYHLNNSCHQWSTIRNVLWETLPTVNEVPLEYNLPVVSLDALGFWRVDRDDVRPFFYPIIRFSMHFKL